MGNRPHPPVTSRTAGRVGTAGWAIASAQAAQFPGAETHLERYARRFGAVEIDTSFYRPHRRATYERWAASVPADFRFSVKLPKAITHELRLVGCDDLVDRFAAEVQGLGDRLGAVLVQLPASLECSDERVSGLERLGDRLGASIQCEPRHASWFEPGRDAMFAEMGVGRVAADPPPVAGADRPAGGGSLAYFRLHGAPRIYRSRYKPAALEAWFAAASAEAAKGRESWLILDNTAAGFALENALELQALLDRRSGATLPPHSNPQGSQARSRARAYASKAKAPGWP